MQELSYLLPPGEEIAPRVPDWLGYAEDEFDGFYGGLECCVRRAQLGMDVLPQGRLQQCVQQCGTLISWGLFKIGLGHRKLVDDDDVCKAKHRCGGIGV